MWLEWGSKADPLLLSISAAGGLLLLGLLLRRGARRGAKYEAEATASVPRVAPVMTLTESTANRASEVLAQSSAEAKLAPVHETCAALNVNVTDGTNVPARSAFMVAPEAPATVPAPAASQTTVKAPIEPMQCAAAVAATMAAAQMARARKRS